MACGFAILVRLTSLLETGVFACFAIAAGTNPKRFLALVHTARCRRHPPRPLVSVASLRRAGQCLHRHFGPAKPGPAPDRFASLFLSLWKGFLGTFFSPDKSVLLFDPLLIIVLLLAVRNWSHSIAACACSWSA